MFGAGEEFGADQMMEKLDTMKALIENVNAQFKNPVRQRNPRKLKPLPLRFS